MSAVLEPKAEAARAPIEGAVYIPVALCAPSKTQMQTSRRSHFDAKKLAELAASIEKVGVLQPILVRVIAGAKIGQPLYEIVAGERRWQASRNAKLPAVPALIRTLSDFEVLELQVIENLQRDDLHPLEEAEGYEALMRKPDGVQGFATIDELAARIGKSRAYVYGRLKLCALVESARKAFLAGDINASTALLIARMPATIQAEAAKKILQGWGGEPASYRQAKDLLEREYMLKLGSAPFKITDETLVPAAGSCKACGKRTGANPDLFDDIKSGDVCTDPPCFAGKKDAHQARLIAVAKEAGQEVITGAAAKKAKPREYGNDIEGFVQLDRHAALVDHNIDGGHNKTVRQLLGKNAPDIVLFEDPHSKALIEVVRRGDAMKVLKDKGLIKPRGANPASAGEKKAKAESLLRATIAERALASVIDKKWDDADLHAWLMPEIAVAMWGELQHDTRKRVDKLLAWETIQVGYNDGAGEKKLLARFTAFTAAELDRAMVAMAIASQISVNQYGLASKAERLHRIAKGLRVDVEKVKVGLAAEAKAKVKKPAAKKASAKATPTKKSAPAAKPKKAAKPVATKKAAAKKPVAKAEPKTIETNDGTKLSAVAAWPA